jgi:hypothetical protein
VVVMSKRERFTLLEICYVSQVCRSDGKMEMHRGDDAIMLPDKSKGPRHASATWVAGPLLREGGNA